jgi:hypothetical protein
MQFSPKQLACITTNASLCNRNCWQYPANGRPLPIWMYVQSQKSTIAQHVVSTMLVLIVGNAFVQ